jgi:beta-lactamase class D
VFYYQELARRVGEANMKKYLNLLNYGNNDISSGIDNFWLCGSMEISITEQVEFLIKMYTYQLNGISETTIDAVKSIMKYESTPFYTLYGKTGGGNCMEDKTIGWYVGFIETGSGNYVFALNLIVADYKVFENNFRIELTKKILKELKII